MVLLEELSAYLKEAEGIHTVARSQGDDARKSFASLPDDRKAALYNSFSRFYGLCLEMSETGHSLRDNRKMTLKHLEREGLRADDELNDLLAKHDVVETYNVDFIQTFRTFEFFDYTMHTLEDLFLRPYWELFRRTELVEQKIIRNATRILGGECKGPMYDFLGKSTVREINSRCTLVTRLNTIAAAPLYSTETGEICGIIHILDVLNQQEIKLIREGLQMSAPPV